MAINYPIVVLVALIVICLLIYLITKNQKDEKKFEKDMNQSELKTEKHDEGEV